MTLRETANKIRAAREEKLTPKERAEYLGRIGALLDKSGIDLDEIGRVDKIVLKDYQGQAKDNDGVVHVTDMEASSILLTPTWADGPRWPVVQQATPVVVKVPAAPKHGKPKKGTPALVRRWKTGIALPDPQIGYRSFGPDQPLDPFHDAAAINVALQVMAAVEHDAGIDVNVNLGDFLDLPSQSRFIQEAAFAHTMQASVDFGYQFLCQQRAVAPNAKHVLLEGNHDRRMQNFITTNALAAFGLKRANEPSGWPVMSLPHLLRLDEMDVEFIDAWPAGEYWINNKLRAIHGNKVRSSGSTANAVVKDNPNISTIMGHIHRIESHNRTIFENTPNGTRPIRSQATSPGCLARIDGAVPSMGGSTGVDGRPAVHWEDWQQGMAVIRYTDDDFFINVHQIIDGVTVVGGQTFEATVDVYGNPVEQAA